MKPLAIVHTESSLGWGGQEIRILTEISGMLARGHRVMLLTPETSEIYHAAKKIGIPVTAVAIAKKRISGVLALRQWLQKNGNAVDIVNSHSSTDSWLAALALSTLTGKKPALIRTRHVSTPINNSPFTRWLYTTASAHIVTTGEALRLQLHTQNSYPLSKLTSVRTGIDLNRFHPHDKAAVRQKLGLAPRPTLGILATLRDWKGHEDLLDALVLLRAQSIEHQAWQLLIVGDGPERERLIAKIAVRGLNDVVSLVGNQENVPEWLSAMDIFVLPSYGNEGVPQSIMQAMACGLPVVSTPVGAIAEAVAINESGMLVATRNPAALAAALNQLMQDTALSERMGAAGREIAISAFGIDVMINKMELVFRQHVVDVT
jgi:glycosyltransferase involved in cell wall biosynthesis